MPQNVESSRAETSAFCVWMDRKDNVFGYMCRLSGQIGKNVLTLDLSIMFMRFRTLEMVKGGDNQKFLEMLLYLSFRQWITVI